MLLQAALLPFRFLFERAEPLPAPRAARSGESGRPRASSPPPSTSPSRPESYGSALGLNWGKLG